MKNRLITGILFIVLGLLVALGPITIFPVCGIHTSTHATGKDAGENAMKMGDNNTATNQDASAMSSSMSSPMKCFWTARAELGVGIAIVILGILLLLVSVNQIRFRISIGVGTLGILALLIPTVLIGVCKSSRMGCRALTLPALVILNSFVIVISVVNAVYLYQVHKKGTLNYDAQTLND